MTLRPDVFIDTFGPLEFKLIKIQDDIDNQNKLEKRTLRKRMDYIIITESSQGFVLSPTSFVGMKIFRNRTSNDEESKFVVKYGIIDHNDSEIDFIRFLLSWIQNFDDQTLTAIEFQEFKLINRVKSQDTQEDNVSEGAIGALYSSKSLP